MPRSTPVVTLTAAAVTLACLGTSLYVSPPVVAETMGRQVQTFAPLKSETYPVSPGSAGDDVAALAQEGRHESVADASSTTTRPTVQTPTPAPEQSRRVEEVQLSPVTTGKQPRRTDKESAETSAAAVLPKVEVALPDSTAPAASDKATQDAAAPDIDSPDSTTVIVNKHRPLPADYEPSDLVELPADLGPGGHTLRQEAAEATEAMFQAAKQDGIALTVISGYRSYAYQTDLYNGYLRQYGAATTNAMSAQPGFSEHQTGLAVDVDDAEGQHTLKQSFGQTSAGQWLAEHAHEFGFVIRYPQDEHEYTGFSYEPWHLRYFSEQYAQEIVEHSGVAEREFGLAPALDYQD